MRNDRELLALIQEAERSRGAAPMVGGGANATDDLAADAPMPIPSTWLHPPREETTSWGTRQLAAAGLGLGFGLLVVVPALIWSLPQGALPGSTTPEITRRHAAGTPPAPLVALASADAETHGRLATAGLPPAPAGHIDATEDTETALLLARSELLASTGDLAGARALLHESADRERGVVLFALAETYDPNMLAAWGLRDQQAEPARARGLYEQALAKGVERARARLDALK